MARIKAGTTSRRTTDGLPDTAGVFEDHLPRTGGPFGRACEAAGGLGHGREAAALHHAAKVQQSQ